MRIRHWLRELHRGIAVRRKKLSQARKRMVSRGSGVHGAESLESRVLLTTLADLDEVVPVGGSPFGMVDGNLDSNGSEDIAVLTEDGRILALLNAATDQWAQTVISDVGADRPVGFGGGLVDRDPLTDLAVVTADEIVVAVNSGDGSFTALQTIAASVAGEFESHSGITTSVTLDFLNGDIVADLAVPVPRGNQIAVFSGEGDGTFGTEIRYSSGGVEPVAVTSGQLVGAAFPDLVVGHTDGNVTILEGDGAGSFVLRNDLTLTGNGQITALEIADLNGDGENDLAISATDRAFVLLNDVDARSEPIVTNGSFSQGLTG